LGNGLEGIVKLGLVASAVAIDVAFSPAFAAQIGVAGAVRNDVTAQIGGSASALAAGNHLFEQEIIKTGNESVAQLIFLDQTSMTVGPKAQVKLDKFVFDPSRKVGDVLLSATKGAFRFVSGAQDPRSYKVTTPVATIGFRGTIVDCQLFIDANGQPALLCIVDEGEATVDGVVVKAGQALVVHKGGRHEGPFTPDGSFFTVQGRFPFPEFGHELGEVIQHIIDGDSLGNIIEELKAQGVTPPDPCQINPLDCEGN